MIRRQQRSTLDRSSAASDVYKRQLLPALTIMAVTTLIEAVSIWGLDNLTVTAAAILILSLIHISEPTRPY